MPSPVTLPRRRSLGARAVSLAMLAGGLVLAAASCGESTEPDLFADNIPPTVDASVDEAVADTIIAFTVAAHDNLGIRFVSVRVSGAVDVFHVDTISTALTDFTRAFKIGVAKSVKPGTPVMVVSMAQDGAGNVSAVDTLRLGVGNVPAPDVKFTNPTSGTVVVVDKSIIVSLSAKSTLKIVALGYEASGSFTAIDSTLLPAPLRDSVAIRDTLTIPATAAVGPLVLTPFAVDSLGQRIGGPPLTLDVQTSGGTTTRPVVTHGITARIEVTDTVHVKADDPTGITALGYEVRDFGGTLLAADSTLSDGRFTNLDHTFRLGLNVTTFPTRVLVTGFARNANDTREYAPRADTVTIVAGVTKALPNGGEVADAYYHQAKDRLYLTNIRLNRLEVFNFSDSAFKQAINVGSRPWGVAPWPRDRAGAVGDTLLVANSGGTNVSYVNLNGGVTGTEVYRYPLPNLVAYSVTTEKNPVTGVLFQQRTVYDFSDRPQFLAPTCTGGLNPGDPCGDVVLVYSTTPTPGQTLPFPKRGTVRWENLQQRTSHFFFEQAIGQAQGRSDTLVVERFAAQGVGGTVTLVDYTDGIEVDVDKLAFRDTTFVRNSGNFRRVVIGEGGFAQGGRAMMYDATASVGGVIDAGVSGWMDVTDFIANAFAKVTGVSINFDGELAAVRGDSTYLIDTTLRLQGLLQTSSGNPGFDFHPQNTGLNSFPLGTRLAFAASTDPQVEIYDTHCYQRVQTIPVRDPIIGPIKSSLRPDGQIMLVGATIRGVVIVSVPNTFMTNCQ